MKRQVNQMHVPDPEDLSAFIAPDLVKLAQKGVNITIYTADGFTIHITTGTPFSRQRSSTNATTH